MSEQNLELEAFSKFIVALEPWLGEAVLIGGWAHRLYRLDPRARKLDYLPLTTLDGDVAVPPKLKEQEATVRQRLLEAGFTEEFEGEDHPPATHYHYGKGGGFYAEFLAPLVGSEYDRHGRGKRQWNWGASPPNCFGTSRFCLFRRGALRSARNRDFSCRRTEPYRSPMQTVSKRIRN